MGREAVHITFLIGGKSPCYWIFKGQCGNFFHICLLISDILEIFHVIGLYLENLTSSSVSKSAPNHKRISLESLSMPTRLLYKPQGFLAKILFWTSSCNPKMGIPFL